MPIRRRINPTMPKGPKNDPIAINSAPMPAKFLLDSKLLIQYTSLKPQV
jgi:hypothetical protein